MVRWTIKNLIREPGSTVASVIGMALSLLLVMVVEGLFAGESDRIVAYLQRAGADIWVMQAGVSNMHMATSLIRGDIERTVAAVPGVSSATPILYESGILGAGGRDWFSYIVGLQPNAKRGGPWAMVVGRERPGVGETVIPDVVARKAEVRLGDAVTVLGHPLTVVGISAGTYSMANSITFVSSVDLAEWLSSGTATSYLLVSLAPGVSAVAMSDRLHRIIPDVNVLSREALVENDHGLAMEMGVEIIRVMTWVGALVAALVVGFTIYAATIRQGRELGIAKALGVSNGALYGGVLVQALVVSSLGCGVAIILAFILRPIVEHFVPEVALLYPWPGFVRIVIATAAIAVVTSFVPARRLAGLDPAIAFRD